MFFQRKDVKEQKIEELLLENYNRYYRLAYSYVHNEADAADIVQNGAYKAIRNSDSLKNVEYAQTWIYRIMLNEIFQCAKKKQMVSLDELPTEQGQEDHYENIDLKRALDQMNPQDKAVIELRYFEDMKIEDIAKVLDENVNTVKSRLYRGLKTSVRTDRCVAVGIERRYCYGRKKEEQCRNIRTGKKRVSKVVYDTRTGGTDEKKDRRSKSRKTKEGRQFLYGKKNSSRCSSGCRSVYRFAKYI